MKGVYTWCAILAIVFAVGLYRGWFAVHTSDSSNQSDVNLQIDKNAIRQDQNAATE